MNVNVKQDSQYIYVATVVELVAIVTIFLWNVRRDSQYIYIQLAELAAFVYIIDHCRM